METIYEPNAKFPFDKLVLAPPTVIAGGNYFIKYLANKTPLYIQPPKCKTRGGIHSTVKSGKRIHCDLMFSNENEDFIRWIEDLETYTCKYIYEHREKWFESEMDMHDIENYFASPLKIYKSGKFYLARTNIGTRLGKMSLKIYDENEQDVDPESINDNTDVITILEFQGIKCSARSFQIEIEMKQMMTVKPSNLFDSCLLGRKREDEHIEQPRQIEETLDTHHQEKEKEEEVKEEDKDEDLNEYYEDTTRKEEEEIEETLDTQPNSIDHSLDNFEVELYLDEVPETETIQIKARNEVYYEMYREAKRKAKIAKDAALSAYLEARQIKNTYMLDDIDDSDEDEEEIEDRQ